ncbi:MAG: sel1 repeat family protein [Bacteroidaceae bacterium]|nr:sel1 repeat family protein [Bacteroidaceae bacterium]
MEENKTISQEKLEQWIQRAEGGDCEMLYLLGEYYYTGTKKDYRRALAYYLQAAEAGHLKAQKRASEMYMSGKKIGKDVDEASRWLVLAANQGDIDAQFQLGEYYSTSRKHDYNRALMYYMQAAGGGNTSAMREIGNMYLSKKISRKSSEDAIEWIKLAAEQGDAEAQFQLSRHFYAMEDYKNWADFCQQAAEGGCIQAQLDAGLMHMHGIKTRKNTNEAVKWLTKAAEQGDEKAKEALERLANND